MFSSSKKITITCIICALNITLIANAQFYTIKREEKQRIKITEKIPPTQKSDTTNIQRPTLPINLPDTSETKKPNPSLALKRDTVFIVDSLAMDLFMLEFKMLQRKYKQQPVTPSISYHQPNYPNYAPRKDLPPLTLENVYDEILRNKLAHPMIVLMQAILETGWLQSHVCRTKHNLFGLTNPRTGDYYEFNHWTESVRAYYTKVQYKYKGGNYLKWLKDLGYAEAPDYVDQLIRLLKRFNVMESPM